MSDPITTLERAAAVLQQLLAALVSTDEEGLIEHAQPVADARELTGQLRSLIQQMKDSAPLQPAPAVPVGEPPRGTDAQILKERELTASAIMGAMAFGYQGSEYPPDDAAWLRPFYDIGKEAAEKDRKLAATDTSTAQVAPAVTRAAMARLSRALGNPAYVEADEGKSVEDALIDLAVERLTAQVATTQAAGVPAVKVQLPDKARAGIVVLRNVVESLLTTSRYVDEEGEATYALADLSDCVAEPPFRLAAEPSVPWRSRALNDRAAALADELDDKSARYTQEGRYDDALLSEAANTIRDLLATPQDAGGGQRQKDVDASRVAGDVGASDRGQA